MVITPDGAILRCLTIVFRGDSVLLVHRTHEGVDDWVLPGGNPRTGESVAACARREVLEETGIRVEPDRVAFVLDAMSPSAALRTIDLVFLARMSTALSDPQAREPGLRPEFVPLDRIQDLDLRPPLAGHLPGLHARAGRPSAPYLGNLWRPVAADFGRPTN